MYLGLDLGTSGVKALLMDEHQTVVASAVGSLTVSRPQSGWSEQDPQDWITATQTAVTTLAASHPLNTVRGIGLSGQMHGATLLGADDAVLRPCMLWNDTRASAQAAAMDADPKFRSETGNIVFPGFTAPKVAWVRDVEPDIFKATHKVLLPKDYLRLWLTGTYVSDMSDAAGTAWLNTGARTWSDDLLAATDLSTDHMPDLVEGSDASGGLRTEVANLLGLPAGIPVAGGGGDNAASAVGLGTVKAGQAFLSLGTSGVLFAANDGYAPDPDTALHTFCHALPGRWHQMGVILAAADALTWYANLVGRDVGALTGAVDAATGPGRALFLPYLGGERTPHNDARVRGAFLGLDHHLDQTAGAQAVLEGVAFALTDSLQAMAATGTELTQILAVGGGARSDAWLQILANTLNLPIALPQDGDFGAAFGAARLGMMAADDATPDDATPPKTARTLDPNPALVPAYRDAHARYQATYAAIKELS